jgi:hypothetical protein
MPPLGQYLPRKPLGVVVEHRSTEVFLVEDPLEDVLASAAHVSSNWSKSS